MSHHQDYATLSALITGVDKVARAMEAKWGVDRLPLLVDDELRVKFERQKATWRHALETAYDAAIITGPMMDAAKSTSAAMQRAWAALDAAATAGGYGPISPDVWEVKLRDGRIAALVRTNAEACVLTQSGRYLVVYTPEEIGNLIDALPAAITAVKTEFPGAVVVKPADRSWIKHGEEIPF